MVIQYHFFGTKNALKIGLRSLLKVYNICMNSNSFQFLGHFLFLINQECPNSTEVELYCHSNCRSKTRSKKCY